MNVVHRDIKPENLLLVSRDDDALVKLADFGFATTCDNDANHGMGSLRTQCGTPSYVAPEVLNQHYYGTKSDMWSVGVILYVLLGGYPPLIEDTNRELYKKIRCGDFEFDPDYWEGISEEAKSLISSLLEVNPKKRLSAKEALHNKWIQCDDKLLEEKDLTTSNFCNLKRFNAIRKVKAAVHSLIAVNRLQYLNCSGIVLK
jgi:calcium/calmodulin-dependent protein kinase I